MEALESGGTFSILRSPISWERPLDWCSGARYQYESSPVEGYHQPRQPDSSTRLLRPVDALNTRCSESDLLHLQWPLVAVAAFRVGVTFTLMKLFNKFITTIRLYNLVFQIFHYNNCSPEWLQPYSSHMHLCSYSPYDIDHHRPYFDSKLFESRNLSVWCYWESGVLILISSLSNKKATSNAPFLTPSNLIWFILHF